MTTPAASVVAGRLVRRRRGDRIAEAVLYVLAGGAALLAVVLIGLLAWEIVDQSRPAISKYGFSFLTSHAWDPVKNNFGALDFIYGTVLTSLVALLLAGPLSIAVGLFLSELAPRYVRGIVGALVEMLAAIPSVVIGLWGIFVLGPFLQAHVDPFLHGTLGFLPFFSGAPSLTGYLPAAIVLAIMIIPITASISRELFLNVPRDLKEGSLALGLTRWETIRGVVVPYTRGGLAAAVILGLGRAIGEAIAVTQVIGGTLGIHLSLFSNGDTLASRIAAQYQGASSDLQVASLVYLALVLLVMSLVVNVIAQLIVRRFEFQRTGGD